MLDISPLKPQIDLLCSQLHVRKLGLFGSAMTTGYRADSDVDVLVSFEHDESIDMFSRYFDLKEALEKIFGRAVDLVVDKPFRNPVFGDAVEKTRTVIYER